MTDTQGLTSPIDIPRGAVDAAARALGNHIELDFDVLPADEQHQAREAAVAALNAAAPLLLAGKDAEIERLRGALISIEYAAERADRKGYDLDPEDVLDSVRRGLGEATSTEAGVDEPAEPQPESLGRIARVWEEGDPEPQDVAKVRDKDGDLWLFDGQAWQHGGGAPFSWAFIAEMYGHLTEVFDTEAGV